MEQTENSDRRSLKSVPTSKSPTVPDNTINMLDDIEEISSVMVTFGDKVGYIPKRHSDLSDVQQLCNTINETIKTVANGPKNDRFIARQVVE